MVKVGTMKKPRYTEERIAFATRSPPVNVRVRRSRRSAYSERWILGRIPTVVWFIHNSAS